MKYKLTRSDGVVEYRSDSNPPQGAIFLTDAEYDAEIASSVPPIHIQTQSEQFTAIERAIEHHMDIIAQTHTWDDRWTCTARTGYANPWQTEAIKFAQWMDACWQYTIQEQQKVIAGTRTMPTPEQAIAELPVMMW